MTNIWLGYENHPEDATQTRKRTPIAGMLLSDSSQPRSTSALCALEGQGEAVTPHEGNCLRRWGKQQGRLAQGGGGNKGGVWASLSFISIFITTWLFQEEGGSSQYTNRRQLNIPPLVKCYIASDLERLRCPCQAQTTGDLLQHMTENI